MKKQSKPPILQATHVGKFDANSFSARLFSRANLKCTVCGSAEGQCDCWTKCPCGWSFQKAKKCRNPECKVNK